MPRIRALGHARSRASPVGAAPPRASRSPSLPARSRRPPKRPAAKVDSDKLFGAIFKVSTRAVPNARSSAAASARSAKAPASSSATTAWSLTIGYLIVEADEVRIIDAKGACCRRRSSATTMRRGFGPRAQRRAARRGAGRRSAIRRSVADARSRADRNHAGVDNVTFACVVSKRTFTGNWEYLLDQATSRRPPTMNWSGAALIEPRRQAPRHRLADRA